MKQPINELILDCDHGSFYIDILWPDPNQKEWDSTLTIAEGKTALSAMKAARRRLYRLVNDIDDMIRMERA